MNVRASGQRTTTLCLGELCAYLCVCLSVCGSASVCAVHIFVFAST